MATTLLGPRQGFRADERFVSTTVFHWYEADEGQHRGPWPPLGGRSSWDGSTELWKRQIKDVMDANIDLMYVHLISQMDDVRVNLFRAAAELRQEGYDTPRIAPFLDPEVTWGENLSPIDLETEAGKDEWVGEYIRFFEQYFSVTRDRFAVDYLGRIGERLILNTWHNVAGHVDGHETLQRADLESRLSAAFGERHPIFRNPVYLVSVGLNDTYPLFVDARQAQFECQPYYQEVAHLDFITATLQPGYWDQNIRQPGAFLPREGGMHYLEAWSQALTNTAIDRIHVDSFNEYDEGSGIYPAEPGPPRREPENPNDDVWSDSGNPREYINTTATGARHFNETPDLAARVLWHDLPETMRAGSRAFATVIVRNEGSIAWAGARGFAFGQHAFRDAEVAFGQDRYPVDDDRDEIPVHGGIFRGRPIAFALVLSAPAEPGPYVTHWSMVCGHDGWFGPILEHPLTVLSS